MISVVISVLLMSTDHRTAGEILAVISIISFIPCLYIGMKPREIGEGE
jgi:hypothetical protein